MNHIHLESKHCLYVITVFTSHVRNCKIHFTMNDVKNVVNDADSLFWMCKAAVHLNAANGPCAHLFHLDWRHDTCLYWI